jgi:hypothetical protein
MRLCVGMVELGHLVGRGPAFRRAVAVTGARVWTVRATQGLWIDVFSVVLVARRRGLGWFQLAFGWSAVVADIIRISLAASVRKHGIKETLVLSQVGQGGWAAISRGHVGAREWVEGGQTDSVGGEGSEKLADAEYCDGRRRRSTTYVCIAPEQRER